MTIVTEYRVGDEGVPFGVIFIDENDDTISNISSATTKSIIFKKPSGSKVTVSGIFESDGSDGKIYYTWQTGDLSESGIWQAQGYIEIYPKKLKSSIITFRVYDNL